MKNRIAFLSTAHIHTQSFIQNVLDAKDGRTVAAIWDDNVERGQRYASMAKAPFVADLQQVLNDPSIDGFTICAENTRHLPLLEKTIPLGKPIFCEKPLVTNLKDLQKVRALLSQYKTPIFCGYFLPFKGEFLAVQEQVLSGSLGKVTRVRLRNAHHAAYGRWFDSDDVRWFTNPELSGGGAFMDMGTHAVHALRTYFGPVKRVWARIRNESAIYPHVDDNGIALLEFASGVEGIIEASWTQTGGFQGLEIVGSEKTIWNPGTGYVLKAPQKEPELVASVENLPTRIDRLIAMMNHQISDHDQQQDLAATLDTVAIMAAAYRSNQTGQWEKV